MILINTLKINFHISLNKLNGCIYITSISYLKITNYFYNIFNTILNINIFLIIYILYMIQINSRNSLNKLNNYDSLFNRHIVINN